MIIDLEIVGITDKRDGFLIRDAIEQALLKLIPKYRRLISISVEIALDEDMKEIKALVHEEEKDNFVIALNQDVLKDKQELFSVLCHECVHIKQHVVGDYKQLDSKNVVFKNKKYSTKNIKYLDLPWEVEAYKLEEELVNAKKSISS